MTKNFSDFNVGLGEDWIEEFEDDASELAALLENPNFRALIVDFAEEDLPDDWEENWDN